MASFMLWNGDPFVWLHTRYHVTEKESWFMGLKNKSGNKNLKILVAEDHPVNMKIINFMLKKKECEIIEAENGRTAVDLYIKNRPDIILMDVEMPLMNGLEAAAEIRKIETVENISKTVIVALTANTTDKDIEKTRLAGMDFFIGKPVTFEKISEIMDLGCCKNPSQVPENKNSYIFAYNELVKMFCGKKEIVDELLEEFLKESELLMIKLEKGINESDSWSIQMSAHSIKGQLFNLRAAGADKFAELEKLAEENNMEKIKGCHKICVSLMNQLKESINSIISI